MRGESLSLVDQELVLNRGGVPEAVWMDLNYSPVMGKDARPLAVLVIVTETTAKRRMTAELASSELRFRTLADTMPQMVWSTLPDGYHDYYNARWYDFTGVPPGSTDGVGWNDMFHPEDQERAWAVWRLSLATGEPYQIEYRLRHHSGEYRWVLGQALPMRDEAGTITRWFGTCTDINESKLSEVERDLITQELSHRIKNIFSVITGLVGLSARSHPEIRAQADQLRARIFALGRAHDVVRPQGPASRAQHAQSSLHGLIAELLAPYADEGETRLLVEGEDVPIDEGAATPLALLFHELATNAAKYGALSTVGGTIRVSSRRADSRYHLVWKEQGGPPLDGGPSEGGFGSKLVTLSVEGQMRGTLKRAWEHDGLRVDLDLPVAALSRSAGPAPPPQHDNAGRDVRA